MLFIVNSIFPSGLSLSDRYSFEPPYGAANSTTIVGSCHTHGSSVDHHLTSSRSKTNHHHNRQSAALHGRDDHNNGALLAYPHGYEGGGTFPRKKENQRFRIPSNPSVTNSGGKVSTGTQFRTFNISNTCAQKLINTSFYHHG